MKVTTNSGKYTVIQHPNGRLEALRYGEEWGRELTGDNLVFELASDLELEREHSANLQAELNKLRS